MTDPSTSPGSGSLFPDDPGQDDPGQDDPGQDRAGRADTLTVPELAAHIARVAAQAFPRDLWVSGQIRNLKRSGNGHVYFDLTEPCEMGATARSMISVTLLAPERMLVNSQITRAGGSIRMADGVEVRIQARLRWYEPRGTMQLRMSAIDPEFTLGRLKADRDRVLAALQSQGLLDANARRPLPMVPLHVALVTSAGSAAHADVMAELTGSGLAFSVWLLDVRTQGADSAGQVVAALAQVSTAVENDLRQVHAVLLVRGGGAATDLAVFDDEGVARAIAAMPVPVLTGIGHEIDRSVADEVAHSAHKTPTAAAGVLVGQVRAYLNRLDQAWQATRRAALATTGEAERRLALRTARVARGVERTLHANTGRVDQAEVRIRRGAARSLTRAERDVHALAARARAHDPALALARGWTITTGADGRAVRSVADLAAGTLLTTRFADGTATSTVQSVQAAPAPTAAPAPSSGRTAPTAPAVFQVEPDLAPRPDLDPPHDLASGEPS